MRTVAAAAALTLAAAGCAGTASASKPVTLRLGYFPNLTHAAALVGMERGIFTRALGSTATLRATTFTAGPAAVEALFSDALDATYIGPSPTLTAWARSNGAAVRVVAGATSGGAALVVANGITSPEGLRHKKIASPQIGNTQDVALRWWLREHGLATTLTGGGDVSVVPQDNATTLDAFANHAIDGAWVPEPFVTRLVAAGGHVLVDERSLWPGGKFVTTHLLVRTAFLKAHPDAVRRLVAAHVEATQLIAADPAAARQAVNDHLAKLTGKPLSASVLAAAWPAMTFTVDPVAASFMAGAERARTLGIVKQRPPDLHGLYDLSFLNAVLRERGLPEQVAP
jgi:NitT/TauT family transport system substrate-binding protein